MVRVALVWTVHPRRVNQKRTVLRVLIGVERTVHGVLQVWCGAFAVLRPLPAKGILQSPPTVENDSSITDHLMGRGIHESDSDSLRTILCVHGKTG